MFLYAVLLLVPALLLLSSAHLKYRRAAAQLLAKWRPQPSAADAGQPLLDEPATQESPQQPPAPAPHQCALDLAQLVQQAAAGTQYSRNPLGYRSKSCPATLHFKV